MTFRMIAWLQVLDVIAACGGYGSRPYLWALRRAYRSDGWAGRE